MRHALRNTMMFAIILSENIQELTQLYCMHGGACAAALNWIRGSFAQRWLCELGRGPSSVPLQVAWATVVFTYASVSDRPDRP